MGSFFDLFIWKRRVAGVHNLSLFCYIFNNTIRIQSLKLKSHAKKVHLCCS